MKILKKIMAFSKELSIVAAVTLLSKSAFANDLLAKALEGDVKDSLGSGSMFWKVFILVDIILATAMAVKSKNPMVFVGVTAVAFIPAFLLKTFVF
jgi:Na+(H+)/acetate symporter ActP